MSIFVVRHGETDLNAARIVQLPGTPLSTRGIAQAERVAQRLARAGVAGILSSDLARAAMTASRVATATGLPVAPEPLLRERDFGRIRGTPYAALDHDIFAPDYVPPDGESWTDFRARVAAAWERIVSVAATTPGHLAVITHGLVCHVLLERHVRCTEPAPASWPNTSVTEIEGTDPWTVRVLNCVAHLDAGPDGAPQGGHA